MTNRRKTLHKLAALAGGAIFAVAVASPAAAKEPFYFVDDNGNTQALYTNTSCNGVESDCVGFGTYCGTRFYSSSYSLRKARELWKYKGYLNIRQNSGNYETVCELAK